MPRQLAAAVLTLGLLALPRPAAAEVRLSIVEGVVRLNATNATIAQILAEWSRVGRTTIVNGDRVSGGPVTLELLNVPEDRALDTLLRSTAGYLAAPRPLAVPNASRFDRIVIIPTSTAPRAAAPSGPAFAAPAFPAPAPAQVQVEDDAADRPAPIMPQPPRPPGFAPFAGPGAVPAQATDPTSPAQGAVPAMPTGAATPGMIIQPPAPPAQTPPTGSPSRPQPR
jgi:hypothetical protein